ncbi:Anaphase-promoting complex subunit 6 [Citrus sinensis]|uniref:Anaphase-promoting complex subunit 6 n=1 Tax=Citrus sinensis TaxID=2711 RepID=A0ACB8M034_CITSI|nr:Anaphase-promoting complex subunit 6 [Citrus sinensis]
MREEEIEKLRGLVRDCVSKHLYSSAIFFANEVAALTNDPADVYMQAQALFLGRHYRRPFHLLNSSKIVLRDLRFRYLAAKCLEELRSGTSVCRCSVMLRLLKMISSAICFLRGKAYEALGNCAQARLCSNNRGTYLLPLYLVPLLTFMCSIFRRLKTNSFGMPYRKSHANMRASKATNLDGTFAPAWIGYGNAFAAQEEGDQAMLGYRTAACLFPGCHLPTLYIGMEYMRTHSFKLAEQFFMQAKTICPSDPLVYNELGVVAYHMKDVWFT